MKSARRPLVTRFSDKHRQFKPAPISRFLVLALAMFAGQAIGQTTTALQDTTCVGSRGGNLTCTAGEFSTVIAFQAASGTPPICTAGETLTFNATVGLTNSNTNRYDIGFFVGQEGNDPRAATVGNICSASVVPTSILPSAPWNNQDGDACADLPETTTVANNVSWTVNNLKVQCIGNASGQLSIPYVVSYDQNSTNNATCSASNVRNGSPSKCNAGTGTLNVGVNPVLVTGYIDLTKQTLPDGSAQNFSFTATAPTGVNLYTSTDGGATIVSAGSNTTTVSLTDNNSIRIYMPVIPAARTLTITEALVNNWESTAGIVCSPVTGGGTPTVTTNNATRTITAALTEANFATACTVTNTQRPRIILTKNVVSRQGPADQFTVSASSAGTLYQENSQTVIATPSVSTTGVLASVSTTFRSTPGQSVTLTDAMAAGSTFALSRYTTSLTCTNAYTGPGATPAGSLPNGLATSSFSITPAAGDLLNCAFTNTAKPTTVAVAKISNGGTGTFGFTSTNGLVFPNVTTATAGVAVTGAAQTLPSSEFNTPFAIAENAPSGGFVLTAISCTSSVVSTPSNPSIANRTVILNVPPSAAGTDIVCTFTNALPSADLSITKTNGVTTLASGAATTYTIRVSNAGPDSATGAIISDPAVTGLNKTAVACSAAVGNKCVTAPSVAQLEGGTFALPALAAGEFYEITVTATVTATGY